MLAVESGYLWKDNVFPMLTVFELIGTREYTCSAYCSMSSSFLMVNPHHSLVRLGPHLPVTQPAEAELGLESREVTPDLAQSKLLALGISLPVQVNKRRDWKQRKQDSNCLVYTVHLNFCQVCVRQLLKCIKKTTTDHVLRMSS